MCANTVTGLCIFIICIMVIYAFIYFHVADRSTVCCNIYLIKCGYSNCSSISNQATYGTYVTCVKLKLLLTNFGRVVVVRQLYCNVSDYACMSNVNRYWRINATEQPNLML